MTGPDRSAARTRADPRVLRSRALVLDATLRLLLERGIAATTIEAVAERSGVAKTTIYRQWSSQSDLVLDAIGTTLVEPSDPDTGSLRADLEALLAGLADALRTSPATQLMPALIEAAERDPSFATLHRREAADRHRVVRAVIERGIRRGELPCATDPDEVLDVLTGPVFYRRWVSTGSVDRAFTDRVVELTLGGYARCEPSRDHAPRPVLPDPHVSRGAAPRRASTD